PRPAHAGRRPLPVVAEAAHPQRPRTPLERAGRAFTPRDPARRAPAPGARAPLRAQQHRIARPPRRRARAGKTRHLHPPLHRLPIPRPRPGPPRTLPRPPPAPGPPTGLVRCLESARYFAAYAVPRWWHLA